MAMQSAVKGCESQRGMPSCATDRISLVMHLTLPHRTTGGRYGAEKDYKGNRTACNLDDLNLPPTNSTTGGVSEVETDGGCCVHLKPDAALQNNGRRDE